MVSKCGCGAVSEGGGSSQRKQVIVGWTDIPDTFSVAVLIFCVTYASLFPFSLNIYINHLCNWVHLHVESSWRPGLPSSINKQVASCNVLYIVRVTVENICGIFNISNLCFTKITHTLV